MEKKYYVVWEGKKTGIFENWEECHENIFGYPKAKYKSFKTLELAEKAISESYFDYAGKNIFASELTKDQLKLIGNPIENSICVDASCIGNPGVMEYQGIDFKTKKIVFKNGPFKQGTNNIGEFLAIVHALAFLKKNNDLRPLYSDSIYAINWVNRKVMNTNLERTSNNEELFLILDRALNWLKSNEYSTKIFKWQTKAWGENPADFGRK